MGIFKKNEAIERGEKQGRGCHYRITFDFKDGSESLTTEFESLNPNLDKNVALREHFKIKRTMIEVEHLGVLLPIDLKDVSNITLERLDQTAPEKEVVSDSTEEEPSLFGFQVLEGRKLLGINQKDFAKMVGVSVAKLSAYEREINIIPHDVAVKMNDCLQAVEADQTSVSQVEVIDDVEPIEPVEQDEMVQRFLAEQKVKSVDTTEQEEPEPTKKPLLPFLKKKETDDFYQKEKKRKPKTTNKKVVKTAFWGGFVALLGFGAFGVFGMNNTTAELKHAKKSIVSLEVQAKNNEGIPYKNMDAGKQFAREFFANYYTWSLEDNGIENHSKRLSSYLNKNLEKNGGLVFDNEALDSKALNVDISEVTVKRENVMDVTARIEVQPYLVTDTKEESEEIQVKNALDDKETEIKVDEKETIKEETKTSDSESTESFFVYMKVEVQSFKDGFEITSIPTIQSAPKKSNENSSSLITQTNYGENINDENVTKKMNEFLTTFFKTYASGTENELQYYVQVKNFEPLKSNYEFSSIVEVATFKKDQKFIVPVTVEFKDEVTKSKLQTKYVLTIIEKEQQFFITNFKDGEV